MNALEPFPSSVLGVLLAISGLELAVACRDVIGRREAAVMLLGAGLVLKHGTGAGFVGSILAVIVSINLGFDAVFGLGVALYSLAMSQAAGLRAGDQGTPERGRALHAKRRQAP